TTFIRPNEKNVCLVNHRLGYFPNGECERNVVYSIPLACGKVFIGQTGQCATQRLCQHKYALTRAKRHVAQSYQDSSNIVMHVGNCHVDCQPVYSSVSVLAVTANAVHRLALETCFILSSDNCISSPSLMLSPGELDVVGIKKPPGEL